MDKLVSLSQFFRYQENCENINKPSRRCLVNMVKVVNVVLEPAESETEYHKLAASFPTPKAWYRK